MQTFVLVKYDAIFRGIVGSVIKMIEDKGFTILAMEMSSPSETFWKTHYDEHFSEDVIAMVIGAPWCDDKVDVVRQVYNLVGSDDIPGTIRGRFSNVGNGSVCYASKTSELALDEIALWFPNYPLKSL